MSVVRPTGMTVQLTSGGTSGPQGLLNYTYDDLGRTASLKRNSNTAETTTYGYTLQGWLSSASSPNYAETLRYDSPSRAATDTLPGKAGLVTEWTSRQKGTTSTGGVSSSMTYAYSYDGAGRLTGSVRYNGSSSSKLSTLTEKGISYDPNGNLLALKRYGSSSGTTPTDNLSFTYTGTKRTGYAYDAHGNVTSDPTNGTAIQWNVLGLPKSISDGTDTARRIYAADGTLLAVYDGTTGTAGRIYAGGLTLVRTAAGTLSLEGAAWEGGRLIAGTGSDKVLYQEADHLGSVHVVKDGGSNVRQRFDYYPFGKVSQAWTDGTDVDYAHRWRFGGKEIAGQKMGASAPAGIAAAAAGSPYLDFGARLYDPRTAAWLSQDPLSEKYYSISPYAYCAGNPVNLVDPSGKWIYIYFDQKQYRYNDGYLQEYIGLDDNNDELFKDIEPEQGSFLWNVLGALNNIASLSSTGSQLIDYFSDNQRNAYMHQNERSNKNEINLEVTSNPIYLDPDAKGGYIPEEGGIRKSPFWLDVAHELAHRQDALIRGNKAALRPWLFFGNGVIIPQSELYATHIENRIREESGLPLRTHYATVPCLDNRFSLPVERTRLISPAGYSLYFPGQQYTPYIMRFNKHQR